MAATKEIGVALIGLGSAGGIRLQNLIEKDCGFTLRGVVSRRPVTLPNVTTLTMEEALGREDVHAVIISTENKLHAEYAQRGLEHGKHVCVDYPIALSSSKAKELYELAEQKGLILQEEIMTLMTDAHKQLKTKVEKADLKSLNSSSTVAFSSRGWIEKFEESGNPFVSTVSGLHVLLDLFKDLEVKGGKLVTGEDGYTASALLETLNKKPITLIRRRTKSSEERKVKDVKYEFEDGEVIDVNNLPKSAASTRQGLFLQDMQKFYRAIVEGKNDKAAHERSVKCLQIAEKIESFF